MACVFLGVLLLSIYLAVCSLDTSKSIGELYYQNSYQGLASELSHLDWDDKNTHSYVLLYAAAIKESGSSVPSRISDQHPNLNRFINGYLALNEGKASVSKSIFESLAKNAESKPLGYLGLLEQADFTGNYRELRRLIYEIDSDLSLADEIPIYLLGFQLNHHNHIGDSERAEELSIEMSNTGYDPYASLLNELETLIIARRIDAASVLIDEIKSKFWLSPELIQFEADVIQLQGGHEKAIKFLEAAIEQYPNFWQLRIKLASVIHDLEDFDRAKQAVKILQDLMIERPNDIDLKLLLANYSFDLTIDDVRDDLYAELMLHRTELEAFTMFNLLEAKMNLLRGHRELVDVHLAELRKKDPHNKRYLWFAYQLAELEMDWDKARAYLEEYRTIDSYNEHVSNALERIKQNSAQY